ncbi:DUF3187 family protein [Ancylomarina longa]|uniref:DUF3187 family protein n=1 Tax=Ancylomarina longa TaxID=2487017 RepID=A0A434AWF1_9BACT|nr:DUF3187 family protein [Ancylomarina longa]RUT78841.1 DUF3187 family protein [Ancylomarina longa]
MKIIFSFLLLLFITADIANCQNRVEPFQTHNLSPLVHSFALPTTTGGILQEKNHLSIGNYFNIANNATASQIEGEAIYLDGEMYRDELKLRYGLLSKLEIGLQVSFVKHSGGFMDPIITGWHKAFSLPGVARETMGDYHLKYAYLEGEQEVFDMETNKLQVGDISMSASIPIFYGSLHYLALHTFFKFSLGDKKALIGSGTNDFGLQLTGSIHPDIKAKEFAAFYSLGYLRIGEGALLSDIVSRNVIFGSTGLAYSINKRWIPKAQLDFHSKFYEKSNMKQLGKGSIQMVLGVDYFLSQKFVVNAAFTEDIIVNTAPDFVLQFGLTYQL